MVILSPFKRIFIVLAFTPCFIPLARNEEVEKRWNQVHRQRSLTLEGEKKSSFHWVNREGQMGSEKWEMGRQGVEDLLL